MAHFDVPGWSIPNEPVAVTSKKRKRASKQNLDKVQSAATNVERLMEQLAASPTAENMRHEHGLKEGKGGGVSADGDRPPKKKRSRVKLNKFQQSPTPAAVQEDGTNKASRKKKKKDNRTEKSGEKATVMSPTETRPPPESRSMPLTSLQLGMKQSLDGARFRYVIHHNFHARFPAVEHAFQYPAGGSTRSSTSQTVPMHMP